MPSEDEKHTDTAQIPEVTFYHRVDAFGKVRPERVEVNWWEFGDFLRGLEPFPLSERLTDRGVVFDPPYVSLFLRLNALERESSTTQPTSTIADNTITSTPNLGITKTILEVLRPIFHETRLRLEALESASPSTLVQYDDLWMLYKPGDIIFERASGLETICYIVDYPIINIAPPGMHQGLLQLRCWSIDYSPPSGVFLKRYHVLTVERSHGGREIAKLFYLPARFMEDLDAVKAFAISRGQSYWDMHTTSKFQQVTISKRHSHDGASGMRVIVDTQSDRTMNEGQLRSDPALIFDKREAITKWSQAAVRGSVNVQTTADRGTGYDVRGANIQIAPPGKTWSSWFRDYDSIPLTAKPDELALMLCPCDINAFSLREKGWGRYS